MLILTRKVGESIVIGTDVTVRVARVSGSRAILAVDAPPQMGVDRRETWLAKNRQRAAARCHSKEPEEMRNGTLDDAPTCNAQPLPPPSSHRGAPVSEHAPADGASARADSPGNGNHRAHRLDGQQAKQLDETALRTAIARLVADCQASGGPEIEFCEDLDGTELAPELRVALLVIVEELLHNACRHSQSKTVLLGIAQDAGRICVQVQDWGIGFDMNAVHPDKRGVRRVVQLSRALGGTAEIDSQPGAGTCILVELPLRP